MTSGDGNYTGEQRSDGPPQGKVVRLLEKYDFDDMGSELERRWLGLDTDRMSLRDLADHLNRELLQMSLENAGERPVEGETENLVELLTNDETSASTRAQVEGKLKRAGLDVDELQSDFVSHQAVYTYLTKHRNVSPPDENDLNLGPVDRRRETILRLKNRLVAVTEQSLDSLENGGHLSLGEFDVLASINVYCEDCETTYSLTELLEDRGCLCYSTT